MEQGRDMTANEASSMPDEENPRSGQTCILIVDDSATIRRSAQTMLVNEDFEVITAENGFEALSKVTRHRPDIIFVDIMMPRLDGYQTARWLPDHRHHQEQCQVQGHSRGHADQQGWLVRQGPRASRRFRPLPYQAIYTRGAPVSGQAAHSLMRALPAACDRLLKGHRG
jgi:CheY-like chemotaxis protein